MDCSHLLTLLKEVRTRKWRWMCPEVNEWITTLIMNKLIDTARFSTRGILQFWMLYDQTPAFSVYLVAWQHHRHLGLQTNQAVHEAFVSICGTTIITFYNVQYVMALPSTSTVIKDDRLTARLPLVPCSSTTLQYYKAQIQNLVWLSE